MTKPAVNLSTLVKNKGALTRRQLDQARYWVDADWESHDIDRNAVLLIRRLLDTIDAGVKKAK